MNGLQLITTIGKSIIPPCVEGPEDIGFYIETPDQMQAYKKIYQYLFDHDASRKNGILPQKSLLVCGNIGVGKTVAMRILQRLALRVDGLQDHEMCITSTQEFLKLYKEDPKNAFDTYGYDFKMDLCIDELGWEATQRNFYGNDVCSFVAAWIWERSKLYDETGIRTHFTTNYFIQKEEADIDLMRLYGLRIVDRMKKMSNVMNWSGGSKRK